MAQTILLEVEPRRGSAGFLATALAWPHNWPGLQASVGL